MKELTVFDPNLVEASDLTIGIDRLPFTERESLSGAVDGGSVGLPSSLEAVSFII